MAAWQCWGSTAAVSRSDVSNFLKSVAAGSIAAASPGLVFVLPIFVGLVAGLFRDEIDLPHLFYLLFLPLLLAAPVVLIAALLIGLPLTMVLKDVNGESALAYTGLGTLAGGSLPLLLILCAPTIDIAALVICGFFGGGVTGFSWWRFARRPKSHKPPEAGKG